MLLCRKPNESQLGMDHFMCVQMRAQLAIGSHRHMQSFMAFDLVFLFYLHFQRDGNNSSRSSRSTNKIHYFGVKMWHRALEMMTMTMAMATQKRA